MALILGIESSCDDTSAAVIENTVIRSNAVANQAVHEKFGGVVPELASRAHQQNIIPVVHQALQLAGIDKSQLDAIAFTRGPGLLGSLLVGTSFAKAFALGLNIPLIEVNHMQAHILAHFISYPGKDLIVPDFPFLCLTVSGGHTQIVLVKDYFLMEVIGKTIDDAAGETFDKAAKIMGLPYPGGPIIDQLARDGDPGAFEFAEPRVPGLDYSFSGLKTSFLYFLRDKLKVDADFIEQNKCDLSASMQYTIIKVLMKKLKMAAEKHHINQIAIAGGVSANSGLRKSMAQMKGELGWEVFIPPFEFTTDNAAMIALTGYFKFIENKFTDQKASPYARGGI
ncbi:MAG: tRNA (adenosine(37)-N6)-threonylcarbamoyltransferase complex transferase subunit TsaD [Bacteroidetes bacterium 4484_276]|nr:MAG: tRNA (adenosine(37)-N6)-threonylcarbamoyltransferase complex transferase subunit TsaD [Bacteroidetes bacterium 4484_276]OYT12211.1 MAG: tRNA (adenosine(37)-N6)-threonylcarbamoyltransferase complex transferase subunit TsaD [Bacteroidetes bacterium 4572_114]